MRSLLCEDFLYLIYVAQAPILQLQLLKYDFER